MKGGFEQIYHDDDQEPQRSRSRSRSRDKKKRLFFHQSQNDYHSKEQSSDKQDENYPQKQSSSDRQINSQSIALEIREALLDFFGKITHEKGFVFTPGQRDKLQKQQRRFFKKNKNHKVIDWTNECQWNAREEKDNIEHIFNQERLPLASIKLDLLKGVFLNSSYLFGKQTTDQLYRILMKIVKICLSDKKDKNIEVRQFVSQVLADKLEFKFFNFSFSNYYKLPESNANNENIYHQFGLAIYQQLKKAIFQNN